MASSLGTRRRNLSQQTNIWSTQRQQILVRKQNSFIETGSSSLNPNVRLRGPLTRGLSVGRSFDNLRHKLNASAATILRNTCGGGGGGVGAGSGAGNATYALQQDLRLKANSKSKDQLVRNTKISSFNPNCPRRSESDGNKFVAWSSSRFKSIDAAANVNAKRKTISKTKSFEPVDHKLKENRKATTNTTSANLPQRAQSSPKVETNRINLNIVLPQAGKSSSSIDNETVISDIDSSLDSGVDTDTNSSQPSSSKAAPTTNSTPLPNTAAHRREQFRTSSNRINSSITNNSTTTTTTTSTTITLKAIQSKNNDQSVNVPTTNQASSALNTSPSLIVKRRPPLVRAMSAPVRPLDENKGGFASGANKRKPRRRRIISRNISCEKTSVEDDFTSTEIINANGKKVLTRSRSAVASDVITLVSLMSSEGSDSEKEETSSALGINAIKANDRSPTRRAPLLRKTGKSVSFQENYPPNFQLASKEYSHMIRRGSIAPLTARLRNNRPPTAPPVSIFLTMNDNNSETNAIKERITNSIPMNDKSSPLLGKGDDGNKNENATSKGIVEDENSEYVFPDYVQSLKERECWKLYQKMLAKGVNVSYDTILRGMLTPTEFRQVQKQKELEEAKAREAAEAEGDNENVKVPQSPIEIISEALLKK